ncbi:MAG: extracellular solute-binding protein [Actinomycetota bacterium]|nr:extracellular solute-binding protein [Actinomycetota bacterium]
MPIVFYSSIGYDKAVAAAFTKKYHIPVEIEHNATGVALAQIEASRDNPKWSMWWTDGPTNFTLLDRQHLLLHDIVPKVRWTTLGQQAVPRDGSYVPTGLTIAAALVYNKHNVSHPPKTWLDLLEPQWKHTVGMNDPSISGPTYPFVAGMMSSLGGINPGKAFFLALKSDGLVINQKNGPTLSALADGQINIALVQSTAAVSAELSDPNFAVEYPDPATLLPSAIGIDAKAPTMVQQECEKFVRFVLSRAGQHAMQTGDPTGDSLYYPILQDVRPLAALPPLAHVRTQAINPVSWGKRQAAIDAWFTANIVQ